VAPKRSLPIGIGDGRGPIWSARAVDAAGRRWCSVTEYRRAEAVAAADGPSVEWIVIVHRHPDVLEFVTEFERVIAPHPGEVDLGDRSAPDPPLRLVLWRPNPVNL